MIGGLFLLFVFFIVLPIAFSTLVLVDAIKRWGFKWMGMLFAVIALSMAILMVIPAPDDPSLGQPMHNIFEWFLVKTYVTAVDSIYFTLDILSIFIKPK